MRETGKKNSRSWTNLNSSSRNGGGGGPAQNVHIHTHIYMYVIILRKGRERERERRRLTKVDSFFLPFSPHVLYLLPHSRCSHRRRRRRQSQSSQLVGSGVKCGLWKPNKHT